MNIHRSEQFFFTLIAAMCFALGLAVLTTTSSFVRIGMPEMNTKVMFFTFFAGPLLGCAYAVLALSFSKTSADTKKLQAFRN